MAVDPTIGARISSVRGEESQTEFGTRIGVHKNTVGRVERGEYTPDGEFLLALYRIYGISPTWVLTGEGDKQLRPGVHGRMEDAAPLVPAAEPAQARSANRGAAASDSFQVPIASHVVRRADGTEVDVPSEVTQLSLSRAWLAARGLRSLDLVYIRMPDDSMTPTVRPGAVVVIDASTDALRGDGLYALQIAGEMVLKRLQMRFDGGLWIRSDNPSYGTQELTKDEAANLYIIGKAIWAGGEL